MRHTMLVGSLLCLALGGAVSARAQAPQQVPAAAAIVGAPVKEFTLPSLNTGKDVAFSSYKGKVVLLNFWASWCGPCRKEMPALNGLYERLKAKGFEVVAISVDKESADARKFIGGLPTQPTFPLLLDARAQVMGRFDIISMPTSFLVGKDGKVLQRIEGYSEEKLAQLEKDIEAALAAK